MARTAKKPRKPTKAEAATPEEFDEAVRQLAHDDGVTMILDIPGVWECVREFYNNDAIDLLNEED